MVANVVTVFGGTGFIGRHVVQRLARQGKTIRIPTRRLSRVMPLRPMGEVGQIVPLEWHHTSDETVGELVNGADAVINLVGILHESRAGDFQRLQGDLPRSIGHAASLAKITRFVQISAIGADVNSPSLYARTKAAGEDGARAEFPAVSIFRPSIVFGPGDGFFARFASMSKVSPALPLIDGGKTRFQPVYVGDVADAIVKAVNEDTLAGQAFELGGPRIYTFAELLRYILTTTGRKRLLVPLPLPIAQFQARLAELLPEPPLTRDQLLLLEKDNVVASGARTLADLGISPTPIELIVPQYLRSYAAPIIKEPAA